MSILHELVNATTHAALLVPALPNPDPVQPPGTDGFVTIMGWVKWVALAICILGLILAAAMMAINSRRGEGGEHAGRIGMVLAAVIIIGAAGTLVGFLVAPGA